MATEQNQTQHLLIRVITEDYDAWYAEHTAYAEARKEYGISDGPVYRDADDPNAGLAHIMTDDLAQAMGWFKDLRFVDGTKRARVMEREIYIGEQRQPGG